MAAANTDLIRNATPNFATTLNGSISNVDTSMTLQSVTGLPTATGITLVIDATDPVTGDPTPTLKEVVTGVVSGSAVASLVRGLDGTNAQSHNTGANVVMWITANLWNDFQTSYLTQHTQTGTHTGITTDTIVVTSGSTLPAGDIGTADIADGAITTTKPASGVGLSYRLGLNIKTSTGDVIPNAYTTYCTVTATSLNKEVEIQYGTNIQDAGSGAARSGHVRIQVDGVTLSGSDIIWETVNNNFTANTVMIINHTPSAGSHTWTLQVEADTAAASFLQQAYLRVNQII